MPATASSSQKPKKTRAKHACRECNSRRVRCNVTEVQPCTNCASSGAKCEILPSRRGRYPRRSRRLEPAPPPEPNVSLSPAKTVASNAGPHSPNVADESPHSDGETQSTAIGAPSGTPGDNPASGGTTSSAPGTLFYGESNFLTLVTGNEATPAGGSGNASSQKLRLTFPIPGSPGSQCQVEGAGISAGTMRYLRDEGALTLPDLQSCLPALQAYFTWFHPCFPILDRAEVTRRLAAMDISRFLLQAMLFIGATYCDDDTILAMGFQDRSEAKQTLYTRARLLFHADWEKDEIILIQSIFLMSFWRGGPADVRDVRYWLGVVITLSESYGLHRSPRSSSKSTHINRMRRRIWWSVYVRERQVAAALGLPSRIRDEDCDIEPLTAEDLKSEEVHNPLFGSCQPEHITYTIKMVDIAKLLGKVIDLHFVPGQKASTAGNVQDLDNVLEDWKDSLPEGMKYATEEGSTSVWTCLLHLAYNHVRILIHRNSFLRHGEEDKDNQVVTDAACRISRIAEDMSTRGTLRYGQMHLITSLFAALCIHVISIRRGLGVSKRIAEHRAQMCLLCLKEIQKYWRINNNVLDLFLQYLDRSIADRLHAAQAEGAGHESTASGSRRADALAGSNAPTSGAQSRGDSAMTPSSEQDRIQDDLFQDQYLSIVNGHWEGDDALGDLNMFLQGDDFAPVKGLHLLYRSH